MEENSSSLDVPEEGGGRVSGYRKKEMSALDIRYLVPELRGSLAGGVFRKIYNYGKREFRFEIFSPQKGIFWLYTGPGMIFLTSYKKESPPEPSSFCMFLRKHLLGKRITDVRQHDFDRIVEIATAEGILVIELMRPGNVVLTDSMGKVIMPEEIQIFKDRSVKPKQAYKYPPRPLNPLALQADGFVRMLEASDKKLGVVMASLLGPVYSDEVCSRAGVDPGQGTSGLSKEQILSLFQEMEGMLNQKVKPVLYGQELVSPFPLKSQKDESKTYQTFSEALDGFFSPSIAEKEEEAAEEEVRKEEERIERIQHVQREAKETFEVKKEERKEEADLIYSHYGTVQSILDAIRRARDSGISWSELKSRIEGESSPEADAIKEIREHEGIVVLSLGGKDVEIDIRKSVEENAEAYYQDMKKAKKKLVGVEEAMKTFEEKKEELKEAAPIQPKERKLLLPTPKRRRKWYEKFHWFFTSDGYLVIGGKNAKQNEMIYSKHMEESDYVFHADIQGASLVVAKGRDGEKPSEIAMKEASEFAAAHCKAWSKGLSEVDVYCVGPSQVSKSPPTGAALAQGSFMITGKRLWFHDKELKLAIGVAIEEYKGVRYGKVLSGAVMAMRKQTLAFVTVKPGFKKAPELAREMKTQLLLKVKPEEKSFVEAIPLEDFQNVIPSGVGEIIDFG